MLLSTETDEERQQRLRQREKEKYGFKLGDWIALGILLLIMVAASWPH